MVTKKKEPVKVTKKKEPSKVTKKKEPIKETKKKVESEHKNIFPTIRKIDSIKYDFNWIGVRRKIQKFNIFKFNKVNKKINKKVVKVSLWERYTIWFNNKFNKDKENDFINEDIFNSLKNMITKRGD